MNSRDTIPFPVLANRGPIDRGDGITLSVELTSHGSSEATYTMDGSTVAVAYVDSAGAPHIDLRERTHLGERDVPRLIAVLAMAWAHARELSTHAGGPPHAG